MKEVEIALKDGQGEPVIGSVLVENIDSIEEIEQAIEARDNFKRRKGGRPNKVEAVVDELKRHLEKNDKETAAYVLDRREDELSDTSIWRVKKKLRQQGFKIPSIETERDDA